MASPDRYARVKRLFLAAGELPRGERTPFLEAQCAGDASLVADVRALLTVDEGDPAFLEGSVLHDGGGAGLPPGTRLGHFLIQRTLGEGGMGIVYEAIEEQAGRKVALKIIRPGFITPRLRSRFRHEIRVLGQLRHPGIAQIYEAGTLDAGAGGGDHVPYFAMELIGGRPFLEVARALDVRGRLALIAQVCDAVHHAHQKGVIHRDLKPGNILVEEAAATDATASGTALPLQVKVLDFGIARAADPEAEPLSVRTDAGQLVGTIPYMSPEQADGTPGAVDIRSDVYSIGVIAYEALAGRLPHEVRGRPLHEAARLIHEAEPARLGAVDRSLRGDVETIIAKALEKDPRHRYQSAAELGADLRRFLRDEPILARPASALYQVRKFARRHRALVSAAALIVLAMAGATAVSLWQARIADHAHARADLSAEAARREAGRARVAGAAGAIENGDPIAGDRLLEGADPSVRGWAWRYWHARLDRSIASVRPAAPGRTVASWLAPAGDEVAMITAEGVVCRGPAWSGSLPARFTLEGGPFAAAAFTRDGALIVAAANVQPRRLAVFDARDGRLVREVANLPQVARLLAVSDDGAVIAAGVKRISGSPPADDVWLWDHAKEGTLIRRGLRTSGLALTPDGSIVASGYTGVEAWDVAAGTGTAIGEGPHGGVRIAVSPDGAVIATGGEGKTVVLWDRASGRALRTMRGHSGIITALAFDPSGTRLASAGSDLTIRVWDCATGERVAILTGHTSTVQRLAYNADGARLISESIDGAARLWSVDPDDGVSVLRGHTSYVYGVALASDGAEIVSAGWDGTVRVWDAAGGACLRTFPVGDDPATALAVSGDGRLAITAHKIGEWSPAEVRAWDLRTGRPVGRAALGRGEPSDVAISRDGSTVWVNETRGGAHRVDWTADPPLVTPMVARTSVFALALSPDERRLAMGGAKGLIRISDARTGAALRDFTGDSGTVLALAFHPTLPLLASGGADGSVRLWNPDTGESLAVLRRHWDKVYALAFSPDGAYLASGSDDTTIRIWEMPGGDELTTLRGHQEYVYSLAFSPDGSRLISGSGDTTVRVWDTRPVHERWRARLAGPPAE